MSYCRFSTDDFKSDVYCYADVSGGFTLHIAANRTVPSEPMPPDVPFDTEHIPEFVDRHQEVMRIVGESNREPIEIPHAGESFNFDTLEELRENLAYLAELGYYVPDSAFEIIDEEITEDEYGKS